MLHNLLYMFVYWCIFAYFHVCLLNYLCVCQHTHWIILTERIIEDHELVIEVLSHWGMEEENKLYLRKNYAKYEFFKNPMVSGLSFYSYRIKWVS